MLNTEKIITAWNNARPSTPIVGEDMETKFLDVCVDLYVDGITDDDFIGAIERGDIAAAPMFSADHDKLLRGIDQYRAEVARAADNNAAADTGGEIRHERFESVKACVERGIHVYLHGPAGTGKNHLCKQVADDLGLEFYFANAVTQEHKLIGFIDANGKYHETQFYKAFKNGGLFMFDEMDASDPEVLVTFNAALANGYMDFPTGRITAHDDFRVVAAGNTTGHGASYEYNGRSQIDAATLNRFVVFDVGYSPKVEESLTDDADLIEFCRVFRDACKEYGISHVVSYRNITNCDKLVSALGVIETLKAALIQNMEKDDMRMILDRFADMRNQWADGFRAIAY